MRTLRIFLFGDVRAVFDGATHDLKLTLTTQTLLAYLVLKRHRTHSRSVLANLIWGEFPEERARSCLNTALWRLRNLLEPDGVSRGTFITTTATGEVGFNEHSNHWIDVAAFEEVARDCFRTTGDVLPTRDGEKVEHILGLYTGDVLESFYADWALSERERVHSLYLDCLAFLMRFHEAHQNREEAMKHGRVLLRLAPVREEVHRHMMRLYAESGQVALAAKQFEACREILAQELGISPMEETHALYKLITRRPEGIGLSTTPSTAPPPPDESHAPTLQEGFRLLQKAMDALDEARGELHRTVRLVQQLAISGRESSVSPDSNTTASLGQHGARALDDPRETGVIGR